MTEPPTKKSKKPLTIYTSGFCRHRGKDPANIKAGISVFFEIDDPRNVTEAINFKEGELPLSNNRVDLFAVKRALEKAISLDINQVIIFVSSDYAFNCTAKWLAGWAKKNFKTSNDEPVKNSDIIRDIYALTQKIDVDFKQETNSVAEQLATSAAGVTPKAEPVANSKHEEATIDTPRAYIVGVCHYHGKDPENIRAAYGVHWPIDNKLNLSKPLPYVEGEEKPSVNRAYLLGIKAALEKAIDSNLAEAQFCVNTDYAYNCASKWLAGWVEKDFKTAKGEPVKNEDILREIAPLTLKIKTHWINVDAKTDSEHGDGVGKAQALAKESAATLNKSKK